MDAESLAATVDAPTDRRVETLDARDLPPPEPLRETLDAAAGLDAETLLLQVNDRAPRHLYPKLADRGLEYDTAETEAGVVTAVWRP